MNIYPLIESIFYKSILDALGQKVVARSFFKIELRSILFSVEILPARLPTLRHLLLNRINKWNIYRLFPARELRVC